jgi:hypothetical protein
MFRSPREPAADTARRDTLQPIVQKNYQETGLVSVCCTEIMHQPEEGILDVFIKGILKESETISLITTF